MDGGFIMSMAFADLTYTPFAEQWFHDGNGRLRLIRPLRPQDGNVFGHFLEALSPQTRQWFAPSTRYRHGNALAANPQPDQVLRLVILDRSGGEQEGAILGYLILQMGLAPHEVARFEALCHRLPARLVRLARACGGRGVAGSGTRRAADATRPAPLSGELGRQAVILMGGVQEGNRRAVHFYLRHGFHRLDSFEWPTGVMNDDMIRWL